MHYVQDAAAEARKELLVKRQKLKVAEMALKERMCVNSTFLSKSFILCTRLFTFMKDVLSIPNRVYVTCRQYSFLY